MKNKINSNAICLRVEAAINHDCPKCKQKAGFYCVTKTGNQVQVPHISRVLGYVESCHVD